MPTLTLYGETYDCAKAQKGCDFVRLLDANNNPVFFAEGITDFTPYVLTDGEWENPLAVVAPVVSAYATKEDDVIRLDVPSTVKIETGLQINFQAPCDCGSVAKLKIGDTTFDVVNTLGEKVLGSASSFTGGAMVSVILCVESNQAYITVSSLTVTGSYVGTGTHGSNNKNTLTFQFIPKMLIVTNVANRVILFGFGGATIGLLQRNAGSVGTYFEQCNFSWENNSASWWYNNDALRQMNELNTTYDYVCIG